MKIFVKMIWMMLVLSSCAYGPTQEKKSPLNYLSGEHYEQTANVFGVPLVERKTKETIISGYIQMDDPFAKLPGEAQLSLISDGKIFATLHANKSGRFQFQGVFPDGDYILKASSPLSAGEVLIKINSYKISDLLILMRAN